MNRTDIHRELNALENLFTRANERIAVLKKALEGRGNPKAPYRNTDSIEKATQEAIDRRRKNRTKKSRQ